MKDSGCDADGFTLLETLVGIVVALTVTATAYHGYVEVRRYTHRWQARVSLETHAHLAVQQLAEDLTYAVAVMRDSEADSTWHVQGRRRPIAVWQVARGGLHRDGLAVLSKDQRIERLDVAGQVDEASKHGMRRPFFHIEYVMYDHDSRVAEEFVVFSRAQPPWSVP